MDELTFREKDRLNPSWPRLAVTCVLLVAWGVLAYLRLGPGVLYWLMGILIAYAGLATVLSLRSWTTVGAAGVSICWGIGRGRTYPWPEIRWIDIREITSRQGTFLAVRITLADGRRRTLPGLQHNPTYPHPTFHTDFHRVVNWWKLSTDPVARIQPPKRLRDRLNPTMVGVILSVLVCAVSVLIVALRG